MCDKGGEGVSQIVIYILLFLAAIVIIIWSCVQYWSWQEVANFIFIKTFGEPTNQAPSLFELLIPIVTAVIATIGIYLLNKRTIAQAKQVQIAQQSHDAEIVNRANIRFETAIGNLDPDKGAFNNRASLHTIMTIARSQPHDYLIWAINTLLIAGRTYSEQHVKTASNSTESKSEVTKEKFQTRSDVIFEVFQTIFQIMQYEKVINYIKQNPSIIPKGKFQVNGFNILLPRTIKKDRSFRPNYIFDTDFEHFSFFNCNLPGVNFVNCNFEKTYILECENIKIRSSLIGVSTFDVEVTDSHAVLDLNSHEIVNCYYWNDYHFFANEPEQVLAPLDAKKYTNEREKLSFPAIRNDGWYEWLA